jgi:hypothetical protein
MPGHARARGRLRIAWAMELRVAGAAFAFVLCRYSHRSQISQVGQAGARAVHT